MRLLEANTANESSCCKKKLPSMFVLIYPFASEIFRINNDIMQRFTYNEKNRDDLLLYNGISREEKCDSQISDDNNRAEVKQRRRRHSKENGKI